VHQAGAKAFVDGPEIAIMDHRAQDVADDPDKLDAENWDCAGE
jgi:hypothetical protein